MRFRSHHDVGRIHLPRRFFLVFLLALPFTSLLLSFFVEASAAVSIRVVSWNLLAPLYAPRSKYPWTNPAHLNWEYRKELIVKQLLLSHQRQQQQLADLICLQEVQLDCWNDLYRQRIDSPGTGISTSISTAAAASAAKTATTGLSIASSSIAAVSFNEEQDQSQEFSLYSHYDAVIQNVTRGHGIALVLLIRRSSGWIVKAVESRSRALIAVLYRSHHRNSIERNDRKNSDATTTTTTTTSTLYVANVHLEAGMGAHEDETRFCQLQSLMKRLDHHIQQQQQQRWQQPQLDDHPKKEEEETSAKQPAIVIMGDWNMLRDNPMYHLLSTGRLLENGDNTGDDDDNTSSTSSIVHHSPRVTFVQSQTNPLLKSRVKLPLPWLPLRDAYQIVPHHSVQCTYVGGSILDYLFVSNNIHVQQLWSQLPQQEQQRAVQRHRKLSSSSTVLPKKRRRFWPDHLHPSDHLALSAILQLL